jgi:hypothetical protein
MISFGLLVCILYFHVYVASKRPVLIANLIVACTAARFGLHLCPSSAVLPPRKNDILPITSRSTFRMCSRGSSHRGHRKRKWSTDSSSWPQSHVSVSAAPILCRYVLTRAIPVRSCTRMSDSRLFRTSYSVCVCLPAAPCRAASNSRLRSQVAPCAVDVVLVVLSVGSIGPGPSIYIYM